MVSVAIGVASTVSVAMAAESVVVHPMTRSAPGADASPMSDARFEAMLDEMRQEIRREIRREMGRFTALEHGVRQQKVEGADAVQGSGQERPDAQGPVAQPRQEQSRPDGGGPDTVQAAAPPAPVALSSPADDVATGKLIRTGSHPGAAACLGLPAREREFGSIALGDWREWVDSVRFTQNSDALSVELEGDGRASLRQRYVPANNGTARVMVGVTLPKARTYRLVQSFRLDPGWDWGIGKDQGGKIGFGLSGGASPTGGKIDPSGFSARLAWRGNRDGTARLNVYSYAADRPGVYGEDLDAGLADIPVGEWFQVAMEVTANSTTGRADGGLRIWIDGRLTLDRNGIAWQTGGGRPVIDNLYYASFYGGNSRDWGPRETTYARVADACWSPVIDGYSGIDPDAGRLHAPTS